MSIGVSTLTCQLWSVVKMVLLLSHGRATVERDRWMMTIYMLTYSAVDV